MNQTTQLSPDADGDRDAKATEALEAARLMPADKEKSEALKRARLLRKAADIHKPFPAKKQAAQAHLKRPTLRKKSTEETISQNDLMALIELGLIEMQDDVHQLTNEGHRAIDRN